MTENRAVASDPHLAPAEQPATPAWRTELRAAIRDPRELCRRLELPQHLADEALAAAGDFPLFVTESYLQAMRRGDPDDPLLRQVLPRHLETIEVPGYSTDPLEESAASVLPGMLHKYAGRALLVVTGACAIHCRYCFRRHFPYAESPKTLAAWEPALEQLAADRTVTEVILSGGDPLMLVDERLAGLVARLEEIPHLRRLRLHTRLPVVLPARVCPELFSWLCETRLRPVMVIHANHARELTADVTLGLERLARRGVLLFNQAVLLAGVNDTLVAQQQLCERLIELGVTPYYLHLLDRVAGAAHFDVPESRGIELIAQLRATLPGYAVPRLSREEPGATGKLVIR